MPPTRPVIALLTDFGLRDHYVAAMKAVMLGICPDAALIDITHDVPPQDILAGALELEAVAPYLPEGSIIVAVVDPGVGSARRGIAVETARLRLVGPDNGLFSLVTRTDKSVHAVELANAQYRRAVVSRTFEGRDRFAPAAAWLATGVAVTALGPPVENVVTLAVPEASARAEAIDGAILRVDRFGNLITNIDRSLVEQLGGSVRVSIDGTSIGEVLDTYAAAPFGALIALVGSTGRVEIAVNGGSAANRLGLGRGAAVQVRRREPA